jgi:hypothetical protein
VVLEKDLRMQIPTITSEIKLSVVRIEQQCLWTVFLWVETELTLVANQKFQIKTGTSQKWSSANSSLVNRNQAEHESLRNNVQAAEADPLFGFAYHCLRRRPAQEINARGGFKKLFFVDRGRFCNKIGSQISDTVLDHQHGR